VRALTAGQGQAGPRALRWDGRDAAGSIAASGLYFARVYFDGHPIGETIKASLVR
jgi:flagellar hook assembly protein FlgD